MRVEPVDGTEEPPSEEEAAAVAAAVAAHLTDMEARAAAATRVSDGEAGWDGERWSFVGRLDNTGRRAGRRVPRNAPRDPWTASGRSGRF